MHSQHAIPSIIGTYSAHRLHFQSELNLHHSHRLAQDGNFDTRPIYPTSTGRHPSTPPAAFLLYSDRMEPQRNPITVSPFHRTDRTHTCIAKCQYQDQPNYCRIGFPGDRNQIDCIHATRETTTLTKGITTWLPSLAPPSPLMVVYVSRCIMHFETTTICSMYVGSFHIFECPSTVLSWLRFIAKSGKGLYLTCKVRGTSFRTCLEPRIEI